MKRINSSGASVDGRFKETPGPATRVDASWLNMIQDEVVNAITGTGAALNAGATDQLATAIAARATERFNALFPAAFTGAFPAPFNAAHPGAFDTRFPGAFTAAFPASFTAAHPTAFDARFPGAFDARFPGSFSGLFPTAFGAAHPAAFDARFPGAFAGSFPAAFDTRFPGTFAAAFGAAFPGAFAAAFPAAFAAALGGAISIGADADGMLIKITIGANTLKVETGKVRGAIAGEVTQAIAFRQPFKDKGYRISTTVAIASPSTHTDLWLQAIESSRTVNGITFQYQNAEPDDQAAYGFDWIAIGLLGDGSDSGAGDVGGMSYGPGGGSGGGGGESGGGDGDPPEGGGGGLPN